MYWKKPQITNIKKRGPMAEYNNFIINTQEIWAQTSNLKIFFKCLEVNYWTVFDSNKLNQFHNLSFYLAIDNNEIVEAMYLLFSPAFDCVPSDSPH